MGRGTARGQTGVSHRVQVGFLRSRPPDTPHRISLRLPARLLRLPLKEGVIWERGRPARILSLWPPLSFSATLQAATLSAETASAGPKENHGAVAGRSKWRRWPRLCQALCGRDARAPRKPSSFRSDPTASQTGRPRSQGAIHPMTSSHQGHKIAEAFWCRLWLKEVHVSSCLFVFLRVHSWFIFMNDRPSFLE